MKEKPCPKCGLIQLHDIIWGFAICDSKEAFLFGCPDKEIVLERLPDSKYDESKIISQPKTRPYAPLISDYQNNQT